MPSRVVENGGVDREDGGSLMKKKVVFKDVEKTEEKGFLKKNSHNQSVCCSDESSSIGKNSDVSENSMEKSDDGDEVQSSFKGPLDAMDALEQVLPIRRGISRFYNGKSKSFACLADASSSSSLKDLAKPENPYIRRRRNLLACSLVWDKNRTSPLRSNGGGISKRMISSTRTTLALAVAMNSDPDMQAQECSSAGSVKEFPGWRSFSLVDLTCTDTNQLVTDHYN